MFLGAFICLHSELIQKVKITFRERSGSYSEYQKKKKKKKMLFLKTPLGGGLPFISAFCSFFQCNNKTRYISGGNYKLDY